MGTGGTGKSSLIQRLCLKNPDDDNIPLNQPQTTHAIYGELTKREPKKNILRLCISVLEPFLTITNGGFDFTKNLQDLINIVHSHL